jgi:hypothetical protein
VGVGLDVSLHSRSISPTISFYIGCNTSLIKDYV